MKTDAEIAETEIILSFQLFTEFSEIVSRSVV
jgi:hypothetical protein